MKLTPMMKQYLEIKKKYEDFFLFFRIGDFYEMFMEDAIKASNLLNIVLTSRNSNKKEKIPMCGVPCSSSTNYINKLIFLGYKVAICEQVEDSKIKKGIVKREVLKIITPGTIINEEGILDDKSNNYICAIFEDLKYYGLSISDISTGEFKVTIINKKRVKLLIDEIFRLNPAECILNKNNLKEHLKKYKGYINVIIKKQFLKCPINFKLDKNIIKLKTIKSSINLLYTYLYKNKKNNLNFFENIKFYKINDYMILDYQTRKNLEIIKNIKEFNKEKTLFSIIDRTKTSMGGRLLKQWLSQPLLEKKEILFRQKIVGFFKENIELSNILDKHLNKIYDIERLLGRIIYDKTNIKDFLLLKNSLINLLKIKKILQNNNNDLINKIILNIPDNEDLIELLDKSINDKNNDNSNKEYIIKDGYDKEIDNIRLITKKSEISILNIEKKEKEKTGIKSLKIKYNRIFGYFFEITKININKVPKYFIRKQTISNGERYYTEELKNLEYKIINSEEVLKKIEYDIFLKIKKQIIMKSNKIKKASFNIAIIDVLLSFSKTANLYDYKAPKIVNDLEFKLIDGRHPVIEQNISKGEYIPNSFSINSSKKNLTIITGPNMAGKSTFIRMLALINILAQCGSYVPAKEFSFSINDRIFARVGASDNLAEGESTFMVEMNEVATIINNATEKSLIILDEVGRGTSTIDGLSIAWAVSEYFLTKIKAKTIFATHYHELIYLEKKYSNVINLSMAVEEYKNDIIFLRKIIKGGSNKSYGINVAKMAGLPEFIIQKAKEKMIQLEKKSIKISHKKNKKQTEEKNSIKEYINEINLNEKTPLEALRILFDLKKRINL